MTATRVPFRVTEEGVMEAHLKVFEKKWLRGCQMANVQNDLKRIATLGSIEVEGAINYWQHQHHPESKLKPPVLESFIFLPCCLTTPKQKRTMITRCRATIAFYPQEQYWSWACSESDDGLFVKMHFNPDESKLFPICVCTGSTRSRRTSISLEGSAYTQMSGERGNNFAIKHYLALIPLRHNP
jgi:hypothetical protein